jgi:hypothetical protein
MHCSWRAAAAAAAAHLGVDGMQRKRQGCSQCLQPPPVRPGPPIPRAAAAAAAAAGGAGRLLLRRRGLLRGWPAPPQAAGALLCCSFCWGAGCARLLPGRRACLLSGGLGCGRWGCQRQAACQALEQVSGQGEHLGADQGMQEHVDQVEGEGVQACGVGTGRAPGR